MATAPNMTLLEYTILDLARTAVKELDSFDFDAMSNEDRSEAADRATEANAMIQFALFDSGLSDEIGRQLRQMEPMVARALAAIRKGAPRA